MRNGYAWKGALPFVALAFIPLHSAHAERYVFNSKRSEVRFSYVMGFSTQRGRFSHIEGTLQFDERAPQNSQVLAKIATASVETGHPMIDDELKGAKFFNVKAQPLLTFQSRSVKLTAADKAVIMGDITVNGITKPTTLNVTLTEEVNPALKYSAGSKKFVGTTKISRKAFKMTSFGELVGDEIGIEIDAVVRPQRLQSP